MVNWDKQNLEAKLRELIGLKVISQISSPDSKIIQEEDKGSYILKKLKYRTLNLIRFRINERRCISYYSDYPEEEDQKRNIVTAYLLIPKNLQEKTPGILALHQHNMQYDLGKSEVVGLNGNPEQAYAHELAQRGYVVLAPDSIGFEERRLTIFKEPASAERYLAMDELLCGRSLLAKILYDNFRSLGILSDLDEVDSERIGCVGHSMGEFKHFILLLLIKELRLLCLIVVLQQ